jgi:membrane protease YdiL (CAAX protease family)
MSPPLDRTRPPSILRFLALAFGITWPLQVAVHVLDLQGPLALLLLALAGVGPSTAALLVARSEASAALRGRLDVPALALAIAGAPLFTALGGGLGRLAGGPGPELAAPMLAPAFVAALGEELGWRGLLQQAFARRLGAPAGSAATGAIWALWHLPTALGDLAGFPHFALRVTAAGVVLGWLVGRGGKAFVIGAVAHFMINAQVVKVPVGSLSAGAVTALYVAAGAAAFAAMRRGMQRAGAGAQSQAAPDAR